MRTRALAMSVCVAVVMVGHVPATANEPDGAEISVSGVADAPVKDLVAMTSPSSAGAYLPPPNSVPQSTTSAAQVPAEVATEPEPTEGWTVTSHWKANGDGTVRGRFFTGPEFRPVGSRWERIDPTLVKRLDGTVASPGSLVPVVFGTAAASLATFTLPKGVISQSVLAVPSSLVPKVEGSQVLYDLASLDTELQIEAGFGGVKTNIVLESADAPTTWRFRLADPFGALGNVKEGEHEAYRFANEVAPDTYAELAAPFAYESATGLGPVERGSAHQSVKKTLGGYEVTLSVDPEWLAGKNFPIVLDPNFRWLNSNVTSYQTGKHSPGHTGCGVTGGGCSGYIPPATNPNALGPGTQTEIVGTTYKIDARPARSYYRANLSRIPSGSVINNAELRLYQNGCLGYDSAKYQCDKRNYTEQHFIVDEAGRTAPLTYTNTYDEHAAALGPVTNSSTVLAFAPGTRRAIVFPLTNTVDHWLWYARYFPSSFGVGQKLSSEPAYPTNIGGPSFSGPNDPTYPHPEIYVDWTPPPGTPGSVTASKAGQQSVKVDYTAAPTNGGPAISGYTATLYRAADGSYHSHKECTTCLSQTFTGLAYGKYYATVTASNGSLMGPESAQSNVVTLTPAPVIVKTATPALTTYGRGQEITFRVRVSNQDLTEPMPVDYVSDLLPAGLVTSPSAVTIGGAACTSCTLAGSTLKTGAFSVPAGGTTDVVYRAFVSGVSGRACETLTNTATAVNSLGSSTSSLRLTVCDAMLGAEDWWSFVTHELGPDADSRVNVANGNLVVQATDGVAVQARGRLAFVQRRTYNSQDVGAVTLPGAIGAGWQLNVGETGDLAGAGLTASALVVPPVSTPNPLGVTLLDRDGTRHVFTLRPLGTQIRVGSIAGGTPLAALTPNAVPTGGFASVCVDAMYDAPPGVELALWRYVGVNATTCDTTATRTLLGFATERPDRLRQEFSWNGRPLSMTDGSGVSLRYVYESPVGLGEFGRLRYVYEARSCSGAPTYGASTLPDSCRGLRITYPSSGEVHVADSTGGTTKYLLEGTAPAQRLVGVVNPAASAGEAPTDRWTMTYHGHAGVTCGGTAGQLCSVTDPRGHTTRYTYVAQALGPAKVQTVTDRRDVVTTMTYHQAASPEYVTADTASHRERYVGIDRAGRVRETDSGTTSDYYHHQTFTFWDREADQNEGAITCREGEGGVHHDLCRVVRRALPSTAALGYATPSVAGDDSTSFTYNAEGQLLIEQRDNPGGAPYPLYTTSGYSAQYVSASGSTTVVADTPSGNGAVTPGARPAQTDVIYVLSDRTASLPPRGNVAGADVASFRTNYTVGRTAGNNPHAITTSTCESRNSGLVCTVDVPHTTTARARTAYTYDEFGQRLTMRTPQGEVLNDGTYTYTYFSDSDRDLTGTVTTAGWLRGVTDPTGAFVAFGYDRAGHVVRTWDRNQTKGKSLTTFPGTLTSPADPDYGETIYGTTSRPWRYVTSQRDPLGNRATKAYDLNGNVKSVRPPRGNALSTDAYDTTYDYDKGDNQTHVLAPEGRAANKATVVTYDAVGDPTSVTDPNGNVVAMQYDSVHRLESRRFTRGTDTTFVPTGCRVWAASDAPLPSNRVVCSTAQSYDGTDNVTSTTDASGQVTKYTYDSLHRRVRTVVPRNDGTYTGLTTEMRYDANGNVTDVCPPREFAAGGSGVCSSTGVYSAHTTYDVANRPVSVTTYRAAGQPLVESKTYDRNGNVVKVLDENGHATEYEFDRLDRLVVQTVPRGPGAVNSTAFEYDATGNRTAVIEPDDTSFGTGADGDLVVDGAAYPWYNPYRVPAGKNYRDVTLVNGGSITAEPISSGGSGRVVIKATGTVNVCSGCTISANGAGHPGGAGSISLTDPGTDGVGPGPGRGGQSASENGGGGGGGGGRQNAATAGADGPAGAVPGSGGAGGAAGTVYGGADIASDGTAEDFGSGGGGGGRGGLGNGGAGGAGGGAIRIVAARVILGSGLSATGGAGSGGATSSVGRGGDGGAGGGGTIWLTTQVLRRNSGFYVAGGWGAAGLGASGAVRVDAAVETGRRPSSDVPVSYHRLGRVTAFTYDAANRLLDTVAGSDSRDGTATGVVSADGGSNVRTSVAYDPDGNVVARIEPRAYATSTVRPASTAFMTRYDYDRDGRLVGEFTPRYNSNASYADLSPSSAQTAQCTTAKRPAAWAGVPNYPSDTAVCHTRHSYDYAGNHVRSELPTTSGSDNRYVTLGYTEDNLLSIITVPDPTQTSGTSRVPKARYLHDGVGRVLRVTDALEHKKEMEYTSDGLLRKQTNQATATVSHITEFAYDAEGRRVQTIDPTNRPSSTEYNADGTVRSATDTGGNTTRYTYDGVGNPVEVTSPAAVARVAPNPSGTPTTFTYTHDNLLLTSTEPVAGDGSASRRTTYGYDSRGQKTSVTVDRVGSGAGNGGTQQFAYYPNGLLRSETGRGGAGGATLTYDPAGRPKSLTPSPTGGPAVTTTIGYYLDGLVRAVTQDGRTTWYAYDGTGALVLRDELVGSAHTKTTYAYSDGGHPSSSTNDLIGTTAWSYDAGARPLTQVNPNNTTVTRAYNNDDTLRTQTLTLTVPPATTPTPPPIASWRYDYDALYRVRLAGMDVPTTANCTVPIPAGLHCFDYDDAGRLKQFADSSTNRVVEYDKNNNRTRYDGQRFTYNADNSIATATDTNGANPKTYAYDPVGRLTADGASKHCYDGLDHLVSVRSGVGASCAGTPANGVDYVHDALDRQVRRTEYGTGTPVPGTTTTHYDGTGSALLAEVEPTGTTSYVLAGSAPLAVIRTGSGATTQWLTGDGRGNISTTTASGGSLACRVRYTPFSSPIGAQSGANPCSTGSTPTHVLSGAQRRDAVTGHYQLGSRTYDPEKAAFLTPDSYRSGPSAADLSVGVDPLTANRYTYVNGDPVNYIDPTGHVQIRGDDPVRSHGEMEWYCQHDVRNEAQSGGEADRIEQECYDRFSLTRGESFGEGMKRVGKTVGPTIAGMIVGGACTAATAGAGTVGCVALGGAVTGGLTGARDCHGADNYSKCVAQYAAVDATVSVATFGVGKGLGSLGRKGVAEIADMGDGTVSRTVSGGGKPRPSGGGGGGKARPAGKGGAPKGGTSGGSGGSPASAGTSGTVGPGGQGATFTRFPLGFPTGESFDAAASSVRAAAGVDDVLVGVRGSAATGISYKRGVVGRDIKDIDMFVVSDDLFDQAVAAGARSRDGALHVGATLKYFPNLGEVEQQLYRQLEIPLTIRIFSSKGFAASRNGFEVLAL